MFRRDMYPFWKTEAALSDHYASIPSSVFSFGFFSIVIRAFFIFFLTTTASTAVARPFNDDFATALYIPAKLSPIYGTTMGATIENGEPDFSGTVRANRSVWYRYKATRDGLLTILAFGQNYSDASVEQIAVDVFRGTSFKEKNRIGLAGPEYNYIENFLRLSVPIKRLETINIRVANINSAREVPFSLNLYETGPLGDIRATLVPPALGVIGLPGMIFKAGSGDSRDSMRPLIAVVNTTNTTISYDVSADLPQMNFSTSDTIVSRKQGTKPGLQIIAFNELSEEPYPSRVGTFNQKIFVNILRAGKRKLVTIPFFVQKVREDRAEIIVKQLEGSVNAKVGSYALLHAVVKNESTFDAHNCRVYNPWYSDELPVSVMWRSKKSPYGTTFNVPAQKSASIEVRVRPHYVGSSSFWYDVVCDDADYARAKTVVVKGLLP